VKGPFDDSLEWPMPYDTISIKLMINKKLIKEHIIKSNISDEYKNMFIRPIEDDGITFGSYKLFPHNELRNLNKNDIIVFCVNVI